MLKKFKGLFRKPTKRELLSFFKNNLLIIAGTFILALGTAIFIEPFNLVTGGVSGFAILLRKWSNNVIPFDASVAVITWGLFFLGLLILGRRFSLQTLCSSLLYPFLLKLTMAMITWFPVLQLEINDFNLLLSAIFSGIFIGCGCAITFLGGGSTGGLDILAFIINKFTHLKSSIAVFILDATIVVLGLAVFKDLPACLLGVLSAGIVAIVIDKIFLGQSKVFMAYIITDKFEEINQAVIEKLDRTTTLIDCVGGYSKENKKMVAISFTMNQYHNVMDIVSQIDKKAFITINRAHAIAGEGFEPLPTKRKEK